MGTFLLLLGGVRRADDDVRDVELPLLPADALTPLILALGDRDPGYLTHREVDAALALFPAEAAPRWVATDAPAARELGGASGVWLLPGTPYRDADAAFAAIRHCLATGLPFLGTCGGFQHALVELARSRAGIVDAAHEESDPDAGRAGRPPPRLQPLRRGADRHAEAGHPLRRDLRRRAVRRLPLLRLRARPRRTSSRSSAPASSSARPPRMRASRRSSSPSIRSSSRPRSSRRSGAGAEPDELVLRCSRPSSRRRSRQPCNGARATRAAERWGERGSRSHRRAAAATARTGRRGPRRRARAAPRAAPWRRTAYRPSRARSR